MQRLERTTDKDFNRKLQGEMRTLIENLGIQQLSTAVSDMDRTTQSTAAHAEESAASAAELKSQAHGMESIVDELQDLVGRHNSIAGKVTKPQQRSPNAGKGSSDRVARETLLQPRNGSRQRTVRV